MITVEVEGLNSALANIRKYSADVQKDVTKALNDTAQLVRRQAIKNAPVNKKKGFIGTNLRRSITADPARNFAAYVNARVKYAEFVEYGTGRRGASSNVETPMTYSYGPKPGMRAQPFMWPAIESERPAHLRRLRQALKL